MSSLKLNKIIIKNDIYFLYNFFLAIMLIHFQIIIIIQTVNF